MTADDKNTSVMKYVIFFTFAYFIFVVIVSILLSILAIPMTGLFEAIVMLGAARIPAYRFLKDNDRLYSKTEKRKLIAGTFLSSVIIDVLTINRTNLNLGYYLFIFKESFNLLILWYIFGPLSKSIYKSSKA